MILWKTRKLRSLFPIKDKVDIKHCSNVIYEGTCICGNNYIGVTNRNTILRFEEHNNTKKQSEPSNHIRQNRGHLFVWKIMSRASKHKIKGRILEAFFIKCKSPSLNNQADNFRLKLFQNGVT